MKPELGPGSVRAQLNRILGSDSFGATKRNRLFLKYAVEETLEGRAERIKAYSIATTVFGRDSSFDPQSDSIVRIEAGRLRRSLELYYLTAGASDPIRIEIPRGSYVPSFEATGPSAQPLASSPPAAGPGHRRACDAGPAIFVTPFEAEDDQSALPNFTRGFTRQIIGALTRFADLDVFGPETGFGYSSRTDRAEILADLGVDFILTGGTTMGEHRFEVEALLMDARTGRYVWAKSFERDMRPSEIVIVRDEVANSIARILAQLYGIIFSNIEKCRNEEITEYSNPYDMVLQCYQYRRTFDPERFEQVRAGLEIVISKEPHYAEAFACLSLMYANAFRFRHHVSATTADPRGRALALARRAVELAPESSRAHHALSLAYWFRGDVTAALAQLDKSRACNPNDTEAMAELGLRYAILADWGKAIPLLDDSFERNPTQPSAYRLGFFLFHLAKGNYAEALAEAERIDARAFNDGLAAIAISAAQLGFAQKAETAIRTLVTMVPDYGDHIIADLNARNFHPDLIRRWIDGLRKAGLRVSSDSSQPLLRAL